MRGRTRRRSAALFAVVAAFAVPAAALAAFPGTDPTESPRANTPNDPDFDHCEADDPHPPPPGSPTSYNEHYGSCAFSPGSPNETPAVPHSQGATRYVNCSQLDE